MARIFCIVSGRKPNTDEVVCFHSEAIFAAFKTVVREKKQISYHTISEADAVKLMVEGNGIGVGCYVKSATGDADALRNTRSRKNKIEFAKELDVPVSLISIGLEPNAKELEVLLA